MELELDCVPCLLLQALNTARRATADGHEREAIVRAAAHELSQAAFDQSAPEVVQRIYARIRAISGNADPYAELKQRYNEAALAVYPRLRELVEHSDDPFGLAVRFSIAGNIIDFGAPGAEQHIDLLGAAKAVIEQPLAIDHLPRLRELSARAERILYFADNAGEIVFDRLLIERLGPQRVSLVVRGGPIINDATRADAVQVGLAELVPLYTSGTDVPGIVLDQAPPALRRAFAQADLIIAKGQGNFETMEQHRRAALFFLLKVKCAFVSHHLGCPQGSSVVLENTEQVR